MHRHPDTFAKRSWLLAILLWLSAHPGQVGSSFTYMDHSELPLSLMGIVHVCMGSRSARRRARQTWEKVQTPLGKAVSGNQTCDFLAVRL